MDAESWRCRRTDGKKWRCKRVVVPDQKYCELHMHRGRGRSRKLVEPSKITSESVPVNLQLATPSPNSSGNTIGSISRSENKNNVDHKKYSTFAAAAATLTSYGRNSESNKIVHDKKCTTTTTSIGSISGSENKVNTKKDSTTTLTNDGSHINVYVDKDTTTATTGLWSAAADKINRGEFVDGKDASYKHINNRINIRRTIESRNNVNAGCLAASGFGFSPESVLQGWACCSSSCLDYRNVEETELVRCRRTDGKKWRCGGDVVPDQKYCERHLHRGAKKLVVAAQPVTAVAPPPHINLDTSLSISIAASPQQLTTDEKSSGSSSDATTITDENGSVSHLLTLSP